MSRHECGSWGQTINALHSIPSIVKVPCLLSTMTCNALYLYDRYNLPEITDQTIMMDENHNHKPGQTERAKHASKTTRGSSRTDGTTLTEP